MRCWLVCKVCGTKEWVQPHTKPTGCPNCGKPQFAEGDNGEPMIMWSEINDPNDWSPKVED